MKLIDFGMAKHVGELTYTVVGSPQYIAPEVLLGKGYTISCDYWSIGIILFEILYRWLPFGEHAKDTMEIYKEIITKEPEINTGLVRMNTVNEFIEQLLKKDPFERLCSSEEAKRMDLFKDFNFVFS